VLGQLFVFKIKGTLLIMNEADSSKTRSLWASCGLAAEVSITTAENELAQGLMIAK